MINLKRAYEAPGSNDGARYLVDRIWPRGVSKDQLQLEEWIQDVAPSNELRRWFDHDPDKWDEFRRRYFAELDEKPEAWQPLLEAARQGPITLIFGARDTQHNHALALKTYLEHRKADGR